MIGMDAGPWPLVATCSRGLEEVLAAELVALGARDVQPGRGMVELRGDLRTLYDANLRLRTAMRVLAPLARGPAADREALYRLTARVPWERLVTRGQTILVDVAGRARAFSDASFAARVVKDAVVDRLRDRTGGRPAVDRRDPDLRLHLHLADGDSALSLDSTGEPLSHRGYRPRGGPAPLAESLAAGILLLTGYDGSQPLLEPMCGTGTLAIEAALIATRTAPGLGRHFACERWRLHDARLLESARAAARAEQVDAPQPVLAADHEPRALKATATNLRAAGMSRWVELTEQDVRDLAAPFTGGLIVANPPYGKRLGEEEELVELYRSLGDRLKRHCAGNTAWLMMGSKRLSKEIGLKTSQRIPLFNGPIECRLMRYDLFEGPRVAAGPGID